MIPLQGRHAVRGQAASHDRADRGVRRGFSVAMLARSRPSAPRRRCAWAPYPRYCRRCPPARGSAMGAALRDDIDLDLSARRLDAFARQHAVPVDLRRQRRGPHWATALSRCSICSAHRGVLFRRRSRTRIRPIRSSARAARSPGFSAPIWCLFPRAKRADAGLLPFFLTTVRFRRFCCCCCGSRSNWSPFHRSGPARRRVSRAHRRLLCGLVLAPLFRRRDISCLLLRREALRRSMC